MSREAVRIVGCNGLTGYPISANGSILDPDQVENGKAPHLTDPYDSITYAIGDADDFVCFDYAIMEKCADGVTRILLDSTVNSETGHFIQSYGWEAVEVKDAPSVALGMVSRALKWCADAGQEITHDEDGYNQCEHFFYYKICLEVAALLNLFQPCALTEEDARRETFAMVGFALELRGAIDRGRE
jgi:hypothetical protein